MPFRFEVAISFAGDNKRDLIREISQILLEKLGDDRVFFDELYEHEFAGVNSDLVFQNYFHRDTRLVVTCVCERYGEKTWTNTEWRSIRSLFQKCDNGFDRNRFLPLRFDDTEIDGLFQNVDVVIDVRSRTAKQIADLILKRWRLLDRTLVDSGQRFASPLSVPSVPEQRKREIQAYQINALIGRLRNEPVEVIRPAVAIANAILRGSVISDSPNPEDLHPIVSVVQELVRDMVSNDLEMSTPAIVRFCVLLHELLPAGSSARQSMREWFDEHCRSAGYDFHAVLGELPDFPDVKERYFWLDVFWDAPIPGESPATAYAYVRCGNLEYLVSCDPNVADKHAQLRNVVDVRLHDLSPTLKEAVNHVSVAVPFEELNKKWEYRVGPNGTLSFLEVPMTVRMTQNTLTRTCCMKVEPGHVIAFSPTDHYSTHVQANGIFATGKLDGSKNCPCNIARTLLRHSTIGLWTRGPADSDVDELELQSALLGKRIDEIPYTIHKKRWGMLSADSCWQRAVLFFDPNVKPIPIAPDDNLFQNNLQLA